MEKIIFYSTGCPRCNVLKSLMDKRGLEYKVVDDVDVMLDKGFTNVPMLDVDGLIMEYGEAFKWINE